MRGVSRGLGRRQIALRDLRGARAVAAAARDGAAPFQFGLRGVHARLRARELGARAFERGVGGGFFAARGFDGGRRETARAHLLNHVALIGARRAQRVTSVAHVGAGLGQTRPRALDRRARINARARLRFDNVQVGTRVFEARVGGGKSGLRLANAATFDNRQHVALVDAVANGHVERDDAP